MAKKNIAEVTDASVPQPEARTGEFERATAPRPKKRAQRSKPAHAPNGVVYLLLEKNGRYKEVREADLLGEAARMLKDRSLRLVKGQLLVPQISLKPAAE